jgi:hypothetical protein
MSYALCFAPEFFWGNVPVEKMKPSERPTSVYQAILSLTDNQWAALAREEFGIEPSNLDVEMVIQRVVETNTYRNLDPPVEIWIDQDGFFTVMVY